MTEKSTAEKYEFQSEIRQLLNILVYSLYKHKDVFVRELVSNAVDALNKVQFESLIREDVEDKDAELRIDIGFNESQSKLIIEDSGVGMTKEELIENIGTIAHSGTMDFLKRLAETEEKDRVDLIGKFGVGFYSSFMAAKEIHLYTRSFRKGSQAWLWKSKGDADYTIEETVKKKRGTRIELFLKKEDAEFLEKSRIQGVLARYSKFVPFPVYVENERLEVMQAIWSQPKSGLKDQDYIEFYKFLENTQEEPETWLHLSSDAPVQFSAILYVPKMSFELLGLFKAEAGVDLYSRKVLIEKGSKDIMPEYLRFIQGVIDSEDIPLNISRETIQNNLKIDRIRKHVLKQVLSQLKKIKDKDRAQYFRIWENFSRNLKEGVATDPDNKDRLAPLLFFHSSKKPREEVLDLKEYTAGMAKDQKEIYYLTGLDLESVEQDPALEAFRNKDLEVLFLDDPLDEFVVEHLQEYDGKPFKRAESADIKVKKEQAGDKAYLKDVDTLVDYLKSTYGERVVDVRVSQRLVDSPCLLTDPSGGPSVHVERLLKMAHKEYQFTRKVLEINPDHDLIKEMVRVHAAKPASPLVKELALQLLDNMLLREGVVEDIEAAVRRMQHIMLQATKAVRTPARKKPSKAAG
ncbi:MAG: molecular chaperone HtpG [Candidatus Aminicenantaceae bacterium]